LIKNKLGDAGVTQVLRGVIPREAARDLINPNMVLFLSWRILLAAASGAQ